MSSATGSLGRRERNKQAKLERIIDAASTLFAERGVDEVTTQQIADAADIGTGTLFLYARTKGELLLLVQNAHYASALARGVKDAASESTALGAIMALLGPVVRCNRAHVENGRTYLKEMVFGDPAEPQHAAALAIVVQTEQAVAAELSRHLDLSAETATTVARVISAIMSLTMASSGHVESSTEAVIEAVRTQIAVILPR